MKGDSAHTYTWIPSPRSSHPGFHITLKRGPCTIQSLLVIHFNFFLTSKTSYIGVWLINNVVVVSGEERRDSTKLMHEVIHFKHSRLLCKILTTELNQDLWALIWGQQECDDNLQNSEKSVRKLHPDATGSADCPPPSAPAHLTQPQQSARAKRD